LPWRKYNLLTGRLHSQKCKRHIGEKLPYGIFTLVGLALCGGVALVWYHPTSSPVWAIWANLICQALAIVLTAILWGQWQAKLSKDPLGSRSPYLTKILATHWLRTLLINADALILLTWAVQVIE